MGFLDDEKISGTTTVDLGRGYWVELRNCLPREKTKIAEGLLTGATIVKDAEGTRATNTADYRTYLVRASIVAWNLDDGDGDDARVWPYNNDAAIARGVDRLPEKHFQKLWAKVDELNQEDDEEEQARFREGHDLGDQGGAAGAAEPVEVRAGAVALEGTRTEPFGVPRSAVA